MEVQVSCYRKLETSSEHSHVCLCVCGSLRTDCGAFQEKIC